MIVNLVVIFIILIAGFFYSQGTPNFVNSDLNRKRYIRLVCFILILQSGLRNVAVGADTYSYYEGFEEIKNTSWTQVWAAITNFYTFGVGKDPGFFAFQKAVQIFVPNYQLFLIFIAIIFFTALGNFIYQNSSKLNNTLIAFLLYSSFFYAFFSLTGLRQTLATAATLFSYEFIKKKQILPFVLIILLASTIHQSCLIFLPFYFIARITKTKYLLLLILIAFPFLFTNSEPIANYLQNLSSTYKEYSHFPELRPTIFTIMMLLVAVASLLRYKKAIRINPNGIHYYNAFGMGIFFLSLVFQIHGFMRIVQYFSIFMLLLIPLILQTFEQKYGKQKQFITLVVVILLLSLTIKTSWGMEYKFFWQEMKLGENYQ